MVVSRPRKKGKLQGGKGSKGRKKLGERVYSGTRGEEHEAGEVRGVEELLPMLEDISHLQALSWAVEQQQQPQGPRGGNATEEDHGAIGAGRWAAVAQASRDMDSQGGYQEEAEAEEEEEEDEVDSKSGRAHAQRLEGRQGQGARQGKPAEGVDANCYPQHSHHAATLEQTTAEAQRLAAAAVALLRGRVARDRQSTGSERSNIMQQGRKPTAAAASTQLGRQRVKPKGETMRPISQRAAAGYNAALTQACLLTAPHTNRSKSDRVSLHRVRLDDWSEVKVVVLYRLKWVKVCDAWEAI